jgi:hypothetical protein
MRVERVVLEHHGDVAVHRLHVVDPLAADPDLAEVTVSSPATMRSSVDLPQPDGPTITMNSPSAMSMSMPWITSVLPKDLRTSSRERSPWLLFLAVHRPRMNSRCMK